MKKILMLKGLAGAGKSTFAKSMVDKGWIRVNKDDLRAMMFDSKWTRNREKTIISTRNRIIIGLMMEGKNIIVDDGNFEPIHKEAIERIIEIHNYYEGFGKNRYKLEEKFFDVDVETCIKRDKKRKGRHHVGEKVIRDMYKRYLTK